MSRFFLSTLPKSGTHVLTDFFYKYGIPSFKVNDANYRNLSIISNYYEINNKFIASHRDLLSEFQTLGIDSEETFKSRLSTCREKVIEEILSIPDGSYVYNHFIYDPQLVEMLTRNNIPSIFLFRDPRDYIISMNNHILRHPEHKHHFRFLSMSSTEERLLALIEGIKENKDSYSVTPLELNYKVFKGWLFDKRVFKMRFEEIIGPRGKGSRFMQYKAFEEMMAHIGIEPDKSKFYKCVSESFSPVHSLFVKGQIGQWKEDFTPAVHKSFRRLGPRFLSEYGYSEAGFNISPEINFNNLIDVKRIHQCYEDAENEVINMRISIKELEQKKEEIEQLLIENEKDGRTRLEAFLNAKTLLELPKSEFTEIINRTSMEKKSLEQLIKNRDVEIQNLKESFRRIHEDSEKRLELIKRLEKQLCDRAVVVPQNVSASTEKKHVLSIVIGSFNRKCYLQNTIDSIIAQNIRVPYEIIVIDGGSDDGTLEWLITQKNIITIVQHNRGELDGKPIERRSWGYFMNLAFKAAEGKYILMLSDDCLLIPGTINTGLDEAKKAEESGIKLGGVAFYFRNWPVDKQYYVQKTLGGKLMVNHGLFSRKALEEIGWVDEDRYLFYKADGDLCLRIWEAGYSIIECPGAIVEHLYDENEVVRISNNAVLKDDQHAYIQRWEGIFYFKDKPDERGRVLSLYKDPENIAERTWNNDRYNQNKMENT